MAPDCRVDRKPDRVTVLGNSIASALVPQQLRRAFLRRSLWIANAGNDSVWREPIEPLR